MKTKAIDINNKLQRFHLDRYFEDLEKTLRPVPKRGWIAEIRTALLMTTTQLARRLKVPQSNVSIFEKAERDKRITLHSLERIADALDCDLHYVLIPRKGLEKTLAERARRLYQHDQKLLEHQMRLEGQGTRADMRRSLEQAKLVVGKDKRLWEDFD